MNNDLPMEDIRIVRIRDAIALTGLSRSTTYLLKDGRSASGIKA